MPSNPKVGPNFSFSPYAVKAFQQSFLQAFNLALPRSGFKNVKIGSSKIESVLWTAVHVEAVDNKTCTCRKSSKLFSKPSPVFLETNQRE